MSKQMKNKNPNPYRDAKGNVYFYNAKVSDLDNLEEELIDAFRKARKSLRATKYHKSERGLHVKLKRDAKVEEIYIEFFTPTEGWGTSMIREKK
jgi:hypothetical protein